MTCTHAKELQIPTKRSSFHQYKVIMCVRYFANYYCGHVIPLDPAPTLCSRAASGIAQVYNSPCQPIVQQGITSDDVCPGCAAVFAGLFERAADRQRMRRQGETVGEEVIILNQRGRALLARWIERIRWMRMMAWVGNALASVA